MSVADGKGYVRILRAIWVDDNFRAIPASAQHLYFMILSDPRLNRLGITEWRPRRLASRASDLSVEVIEDAAKHLQHRRFIILDEDTEEVMVRSYIRHDRAWKVPNHSQKYIEDFVKTDSPKCRETVSAELRRLRAEDDQPAREVWVKLSALADWESEKPQVASDEGTPLEAPLRCDPSWDRSSDRSSDEGAVFSPLSKPRGNRADQPQTHPSTRPGKHRHETGKPQVASDEGTPQRPDEGSPLPSDGGSPCEPCEPNEPIKQQQQTRANEHEPRSRPVPPEGWRLVREEIDIPIHHNVKTALAIEAAALLHARTEEADVRETLRTWKTRPGLGPKMLPHLLSDIQRTRAASDPLDIDAAAKAFADRMAAKDRQQQENIP
ncbi:hypothetical protein [Hoyosella altamirensis]|uniref:Uncharacterized protein n=1 Tax=Hoyosella altamirensis TaxID=616997 RepID=A0A839RUC1_9ACTN|nr:hypothetical protein [Hoyosella altamirensis]MBB3040170.1 hypothetical protein [Hoyosella altamirensis]